MPHVYFIFLVYLGGYKTFIFTERSMSYSDESRLSNLLRRITREDDRDRRLATVKQLKEFIQQPENKLVSKCAWSCRVLLGFPKYTKWFRIRSAGVDLLLGKKNEGLSYFALGLC